MRRIEGRAQENALQLQQCQEEPGAWSVYDWTMLSFTLRVFDCGMQRMQDTHTQWCKMVCIFSGVKWALPRLRQKASELETVDATLASVQPEAQRLAVEEAGDVSGSTQAWNNRVWILACCTSVPDSFLFLYLTGPSSGGATDIGGKRAEPIKLD